MVSTMSKYGVKNVSFSEEAQKSCNATCRWQLEHKMWMVLVWIVDLQLIQLEVVRCSRVDTRAITSWKTGQVTELKPRINKNCEKLALNVPQEQTRVRLALRSWVADESEDIFLQRMRNCSIVQWEFAEHNNSYKKSNSQFHMFWFS